MTVVNVPALVLLVFCIIVEIYHIFCYQWVECNSTLITEALKKVGSKEYDTAEDDAEESGKDIFASLGITNKMIKTYISSLLVEIMYWVVLAVMILIFGLPGIALFTVMCAMSIGAHNIKEVLKVKESFRACARVTVIDAILSICIYVAYIYIYCLVR